MANNNNPQLNMDQIRDLLSPYLDGEITGEERMLVEQALAASPELQRELESLRRTVAMVAALPPMPAPRPFTLTKAVVRPSTPKSKGFLGLPSWAMGWATLAATLLCVLIAGGLFWTMQFGRGGMPAMAPAEIAVAPTYTAMLAAEAPAAEKPVEEPAAKKEVSTESPTEAPVLEMAAPAPPATEEEIGAAAAAKPAADEAAPQAAEDTTIARQAITEAETTDTLEQNTESYAVTTAATEPAPTPSLEPTLMTFAAPTATEEQTMSAAQAQPEQPASGSIQTPAATAQPEQELLKQEGAAQPAEALPNATPLQTAILAPMPTQTPTPLPSPTVVALLTLPAPLTPTLTVAPVATTAPPSDSGRLISVGIILVLLVLLVIGLLMGIKRSKGRS